MNQYCGLIADEDVKNLFASAKICPNLSEPHAQEFGIDINERIFKILYAGGFCISDNVESYKMFGDGLVIADNPQDFQEKVDYYLKNKDEREKISSIGKGLVKDNHTGFHRIAKILEEFGYAQTVPTITNFLSFSYFLQDSIRFIPIAKFSYMKRPGFSLFAPMPPTLAAK